MMRQKSLFNPKLALEDLKQNKHIIILYTVALLLCTLLPALLCYSNYLENVKENAYALGTCANLLEIANPFVMILTFTAAFIFVILQFNYLYKQSSVIFVHSMPYTRANIIITKYISGLIGLVVPIILVSLINMLCAKIIGVDYIVPRKEFAAVAAYCALSTLFCYSVMVLAQTVSSGIFSLFISSAFLFLLYPVTKLVAAGLVSVYLKSYGIETLFSRELDFIFPFWKVASATDSSAGLTWGFSAYLVITSLILLAVSAVVYSKRKSENSNKFFAFDGVNKFLKYYITVFLAMGAGVLTGTAAGGSFGISYIMYIIAAIIIFAVLQAIFDKNIKNMFANKLSLGAVLLVITAIVCAFKFDVLNLNNHVPDARKTNSITVTVPLEFSDGLVTQNEYTFTDKRIIEKSILLMKSGEPAYNRGWTSDDGLKNIKFQTDKYKKLGISRCVLVPTEDYKNFAAAIFESEEFKATLVPDSSQIKKVNWAYVNLNTTNENFNIGTREQIERLLTAYASDIKNVTSEDFANKKAVCCIEYEITVSDPAIVRSSTRYVYTRVPVYESCTETMRLIDKYYKDWQEDAAEAKNADGAENSDNEQNADNAESESAAE